MLPTNEKSILDVDGLDLLHADEKRCNEIFVKKLIGYAEGKVDGIQIKNLTAGVATIAKRQQSRSAVAMLKWSMELKKNEAGRLIEARELQSITSKKAA